MRRSTLSILTLILTLTALPAFAQKVFIDYDHATAFSEYMTFQFVETPEDLRDYSTLVHKRTVAELESLMIEGGLEKVDSDPDIYMTYYTADRGDLRLALGDLRYAYGADFDFGGYWEGGVGTRTPDSFTFKQGTLVIDIWEAEGHRLVWRAIATAALKKKPDKNEKKLQDAIARIAKQWYNSRGAYLQAVREMKAEERDQQEP